jgi:hypothetical protein
MKIKNIINNNVCGWNELFRPLSEVRNEKIDRLLK